MKYEIKINEVAYVEGDKYATRKEVYSQMKDWLDVEAVIATVNGLKKESFLAKSSAFPILEPITRKCVTVGEVDA
jgi:hypothetical protein